jgi:DNA repair photolyase
VRDSDLLARLAAVGASRVWLSVTSLDPRLTRRLEPRTSTPSARLAAIRRLTDAGVPCGVLAAPMIPGLTDHELPAILDAAATAGARWARSMPVRLPGAVAAVFRDWLEREEPNRAARVLGGIRSMRRGGLDDAVFGRRMRGDGPHAETLHRMFRIVARRHGLETDPPALCSAHFAPPGGAQLELFAQPRSGSG